ncbi:ribonuclease H-like domain-containing protein [Tanacetum coccineum]
MVTVRCLISIVVVNCWPLYQLDVNNALLYSDLIEDVYMSLPQGYENVDKTKVCKLTKSLYGLKQALRQWNAKLTTTLAEHGFEKYYLKLLYEYGLLAATPVDIPLPKNNVLCFEESENDKYLNDFTRQSLVSWKSKKHATLSKSSSEAKYTTIQIDVNLVFHERTKHFELDVHFIREKVMVGVIKNVKVDTIVQVAVIFTKCLGVVKHSLFCRKIFDVGNFAKKESMKKAFQDMMHQLGEVNPTHANYNGSRTSKDTEDPSWSTVYIDDDDVLIVRMKDTTPVTMVVHDTELNQRALYTLRRTGTKFDLFSDHENQSEEEVAEAMGEPTMNHKTIDQSTKNALWDYWKRGDDEEVKIDNELSSPRDDDSIDENEIAQIFRIDTDKEDGYCNAGDLLVFICNGNSIRYEDYEWYDTIKDSELKEEALTNKKILEESMNVMKESIMDHCKTQEEQGWFDEHELMEDDDDDISDLEDYLIQKDPPYYVNEEEERSKERRCKIEKFEVVKYSFGPAEICRNHGI